MYIYNNISLSLYIINKIISFLKSVILKCKKKKKKKKETKGKQLFSSRSSSRPFRVAFARVRRNDGRERRDKSSGWRDKFLSRKHKKRINVARPRIPATRQVTGIIRRETANGNGEKKRKERKKKVKKTGTFTDRSFNPKKVLLKWYHRGARCFFFLFN